jgi:uncharacterized membrane protein YeaQ/YmgE (transglycosylase-associated protein family)
MSSPFLIGETPHYYKRRNPMSLIAWIVVGLIAGWLAGQVMKGRGYGVVGDIIVGVLGAMVGGFLATVLFGGDYLQGINLVTIITAFLGAILMIALIRALPGRSPV